MDVIYIHFIIKDGKLASNRIIKFRERNLFGFLFMGKYKFVGIRNYIKNDLWKFNKWWIRI